MKTLGFIVISGTSAQHLLVCGQLGCGCPRRGYLIDSGHKSASMFKTIRSANRAIKRTMSHSGKPFNAFTVVRVGAA